MTFDDQGPWRRERPGCWYVPAEVPGTWTVTPRYTGVETRGPGRGGWSPPCAPSANLLFVPDAVPCMTARSPVACHPLHQKDCHAGSGHYTPYTLPSFLGEPGPVRGMLGLSPPFPCQCKRAQRFLLIGPKLAVWAPPITLYCGQVTTDPGECRGKYIVRSTPDSYM